jgi:hypothetical protein
MVASIRNRFITNTTGAVVVAGGAIIDYGNDNGFERVTRKLAAIDVGSTAGKIQHADGMIFAEFRGATIKPVTLEVQRDAAGDGTGFFYNFYYLTDARAYPGYKIVTANGISTLFVRDGGAGNGLLTANDSIVAYIELGNS